MRDNDPVTPTDDAPAESTAGADQPVPASERPRRIGLFVAEFGAGDTAPEPFASCHGGVDPADLPSGGIAA